MTADVSSSGRFAHILCAIDDSETARHALAHAVVLARWHGTRLTVIHALPVYNIAVTELPDERAMQEARRWATREVAQCCATLGANPVEPHVIVEVGNPASVITQHATSLGADLLVIGTHGASGVERFIMGSVAEKVLRTALCPVLTVPPKVHAAPVSAFERILCPIDFSECSLSAYALAGTIAARTGGSLTLIHTVEWPWVEPPAPLMGELPAQQAVALAEYRRYVTAEVTAALAGLTKSAPGDRVSVEIRVAHGRPAQEVVKAATELHADLIVMGVHGHHALDVALFGSVTHRVLRGASCPVLTTCR